MQNPIQPICDLWGVTPEQLTGKSKPTNIVEARQVLAWYLVNIDHFRLTAVGMMLNRTHATILHAVETVDGALKVDRQLQRKVATLLSRLNHEGQIPIYKRRKRAASIRC
jgi:chromosomal replication initiator protein